MPARATIRPEFQTVHDDPITTRSDSLPRITLRPGKERPLRGGHPWLFSGAIASAEEATDGETVELRAADGSFVARGYYNSRSQISARVWSVAEEAIDRAFLRRRLERAIAHRDRLGLRFAAKGAPTTAFRLVNAEADLLPGLIVDAYGPFLALQALTLGVERRLPELVELLEELLAPTGIWERSDVEVRRKEGLELRTGGLAGQEPPALLEVREHGLPFLVDCRGGQKTGFYLDQRENRRRAALLLEARRATAGSAAPPPRVLNAFAFTGAFAVHLGRSWPGAELLNLDASAPALELARANLELNGLLARAELIEGDAFAQLRACRDSRQSFDVIVLDPPKFAPGAAQVERACRGYKDLNLLALKLLRPAGLLFTFSCSGLVSRPLFRKVLRDAALDAGRPTQVLDLLGHAPDHPLLLSFPEGEYLKGVVLQVIS